MIKYFEGSSIDDINKVEILLKENNATFHIKDLDPAILIGKSPQEILIILIDKQYKTETLYGNGEVQCDKERYKSQEDLYKIMKYYYPILTLVELRQLLLNLVNDKRISTFHCNNINKRIYFNKNKHHWTNGQIGNLWKQDEFGLIFIGKDV
jgi:hypothetical protein